MLNQNFTIIHSGGETHRKIEAHILAKTKSLVIITSK